MGDLAAKFKFLTLTRDYIYQSVRDSVKKKRFEPHLNDRLKYEFILDLLFVSLINEQKIKIFNF